VCWQRPREHAETHCNERQRKHGPRVRDGEGSRVQSTGVKRKAREPNPGRHIIV